METRRRFLELVGGGAAAALGFASLRDDGLSRILEASAAVEGQAPADVARDEAFWREIQEAFTLDRTITNLNNGGVCPSPRVVHEAFKRYLDISNQAPVYHMWQILEPNIETVRRRLAADFGCSPEELAVTRNASEALQIAQLGVTLAPGDEVVTTTQDYPRMLDTWDQRVRRDGITLTKIRFDVPVTDPAAIVRAFEQAITPKTKVLHFCHVIFLTGQIMPVGALCRLARARGIATIVDGAHAFAHIPFTKADFDCDYYGATLHKWLLAPVGTGFLYVKKENIPGLWPLTPANASRSGDIRKFEEIGTHPAANHNAIAEALTFHHGIGAARKIARLRYLRDRWAKRIEQLPNVAFFARPDDANTGGLVTAGIEGVDPGKLTSHLWNQYRIIVVSITHEQFKGIRVTPNVYTTLEELDAFGDVLEEVARKGLPG